MELKGTKINFLGDSITEGSGTSSHEKMYTMVIEREYGAICRNYGIGGTRIARQTTPTEEKYDRDFISRVPEMDNDADIVVVFGGTNDFGHGDAPLGKSDSRDEGTFRGALNVLCENLINAFPKARIAFITPLHRLNEDADWNSFGVRNAAPLSGYCDIIKEICPKYSIPVFDAYSEIGINPVFEAQKEIYMPDGLHPSDNGHERLADYIISKLKAM